MKMSGWGANPTETMACKARPKWTASSRPSAKSADACCASAFRAAAHDWVMVQFESKNVTLLQVLSRTSRYEPAGLVVDIPGQHARGKSTGAHLKDMVGFLA